MQKLFGILIRKCLIGVSLSLLLSAGTIAAESKKEVRTAMKKATRYMVEEVSHQGGYLWHYLPDFSRQWGEMEAYDTMIWVQGGTVRMGHLFLDLYEGTGDEYYYQAAQDVAEALIWGQHEEGGWNYMIDFAGDRSLKRWYNTIGKNGWMTKEFHYYYGNATYDDNVTTGAASFLLRIYLTKNDPTYLPSLRQAIDFILESQYAVGGWPQRYPIRHDYRNDGRPDYTSYITFNDDVTWENVKFLIQCYGALGYERLLHPIRRGMTVYLVTQHGPPQSGWGQQYTLDLEPAGARVYEPKSLQPSYTADHIRILLKCYRLTGQSRFLARIPDALEWLERTKLPPQLRDGEHTHPYFVELGTNKPLFNHRIGTNVINGKYYHDHQDTSLITHYPQKADIDLIQLRKEFERVKNMSIEEATADSPLLPGKHTKSEDPQAYYATEDFLEYAEAGETASAPSPEEVREVINALDDQGRWLVRHVRKTNPYIGQPEPNPEKLKTKKYAQGTVGNRYDTAPFTDTTDQEYISTGEYIENMEMLLQFLSNQE